MEFACCTAAVWHGWEAWRTMPLERDRLYALIGETGANGVVIVSGEPLTANG